MTCAVCVTSTSIPPPIARIKWDPAQLSLSDILKGFARVGYRAYPFQTHQQEALYAKEVRSYMFRMALAGLGSMR